MSLISLKNDFTKGVFSKKEYIEKMYAYHKALFEYSEFLAFSSLTKIEILNGKIIVGMKTVASDKEIKLVCIPNDSRTTALEVLNFGEYESGDSKILFELFSPDAVIFDIGANIGWYALNFANSLNQGRVFAFEPIPLTHQNLLENIALNQSDKIEVFNIALSNFNGISEFFFSPEELGASSAMNIREDENILKVSCKTQTLDSFVAEKNIEKVDLIKVDVEGGELRVFEGGKNSIQQFKPIVFSEMLRKWAQKFDYHPNDIIRFFAALDYRCFYASESKLKEIFMMDENTVETNFIFLHSEKHKEKILKLA